MDKNQEILITKESKDEVNSNGPHPEQVIRSLLIRSHNIHIISINELVLLKRGSQKPH